MKKIMTGLLMIVTLMSFQTTNPKKQTVPKPPATTKPAVKQTAAKGLQGSILRGKEVYLLQCLACHQVDGGGVPHLNAPLDGATQVVNNNKQRLIRIVLKGMSESVELDGEYYSNKMLPHSDLTDLQIADVLTYIRNSWSNKASAVSAAEVKAVRAKLK